MSIPVGTERFSGGFRIGAWHVEPLRNRISNGDENSVLEPKVMDVLVCLARFEGRTVTKDQFMSIVWEGTVVSDDVLSRCISELRKAMSDDPRSPRYIETIRKTGYRLIPSVELEASEPDEPFRPAAVNAESAEIHSDRRSAIQELNERFARIGMAVRSRGPAIYAVAASGMMLLAVVLWWILNPPEPEVRVPTIVPFTSYTGLEVEPALAPDGKQVAFAWDNDTGLDFDIYIKQFGNEQPLRITDSPDNERSPAWSPDGLKLAFVRTGINENAVYIMPSLGGAARRIADFGNRTLNSVDWSPDGLYLVVSARRALYGESALFIVSVDSSTTRQVSRPPEESAGDFRPSFSPDASRIAFVRAHTETAQDVYVMSVDDGQITRLTSDNAMVSGLAWGGDGDELLFSSDREGTCGIWRVPATGGDVTNIVLASEGATIQDLSASIEAGRLAYAQRFVNVNLWRLARSEPSMPFRAHRLISSTRQDANPRISPDGSRIAFVSNRSGYYAVWATDSLSESAVQLTFQDGMRAALPRWSPDGTTIAYAAIEGGQGDIFTVDSEGGTPSRLTDSPSDDTAPFWSRDGRWMNFISNRTGVWQLWRMPAAGGEAFKVSDDSIRAAAAAADSLSMYYVRTGTPGIWTISPPVDSLESITTRLLFDSLLPDDWGNWSVSDKGIYYVRRETPSPMLAFYSFAEDSTIDVTPLGRVPSEASLSAASDGSWFLYGQVDRDESDILLMTGFDLR